MLWYSDPNCGSSDMTLSTIYRLHQLTPRQVKDGRSYLLVVSFAFLVIIRKVLVFQTWRLSPTRVSLESMKLLVAWGAIGRSVEVWEAEANLELLRTRPQESLAYNKATPTPITARRHCSLLLTHPFITWTIFLLIILSRPTFPLSPPFCQATHIAPLSLCLLIRHD